MSSKKLSLPNTPSYYQNPLQQGDMGYQSQTAHNLISGNFGGDLSWLNGTINPSGDYSKMALQGAQGLLQPQFRDTLQQINNQAAANNQMNSSTYTDALARSQSDLNSQYQSIVSNAAMQDYNNANQNRLSLFGSGLNTLQGAIGNEQQDSGAHNQFNLDNYSNLVAKAVQDNQNANKANGWQQALGMISPLGHDYLQSQGINSVPGYGVADIAKIGSMFMGGGGGLGGGMGSMGGSMGGQMPMAAPRSSAFNSFDSNQSYYNPLRGALNTPGIYN